LSAPGTGSGRLRTVALDGPAASGKSTVGRALAARLGFLFLDTGLLYRALTRLAVDSGVSVDDGPALAALAGEHTIDVRPRDDATGPAVLIDGREITGALQDPRIDRAVSPVSAHPAVRDALLPHQRRPAERGNVVMAGRDIGTVVLPDADLKIYLDASAEARARRRLRERLARGEAADFAEVLAAVRARDAHDSRRATAPLAKARDAVVVSTDACDADGVVRHLLALAARWPDRLTTEGGRAPCPGDPGPRGGRTS
jgi:CMP/dCMP kinase